MRVARYGRVIVVLVAYAAITVVMTWPVTARLARDLPADMGDPVLNCWILAWDADHIIRFMGGEWWALRDYWSANIFHPEPLTLAYSEHLTAQAIQIAIPYALTRNPVLCYNLLFLSTFLLSAVGAYLLVRELTGDDRPAFIAGLLFGFGLYRFTQLPHLQVLSAHWMPFVLLGLDRFVRTRSRLALALGCLALVLQNLSCGYHLMYFFPLAAVYVVNDVVVRGRFRDRRIWSDLIVAGLAVIALTLPFLLPYHELRARGGIVRQLWEVELFSADVYSYLTATDLSKLWGGVLRAYPKSEGALFPGLAMLLLGATAVVGELVAALRTQRASRTATENKSRSWRAFVSPVACVVLLVHAAGATLITLGARGRFYGIGRFLPLRDFRTNVEVAIVAAVILFITSRYARRVAAQYFSSGVAFHVIAAITLFFLSLGPTMHARGLTFGSGPYLWLFDFVPGFDGLRVPARFAWELNLLLVVLTGVGSARLLSLLPRGRRLYAITIVLGTLVLVESFAAPLPMNVRYRNKVFRHMPRQLETGPGPRGIYRAVAALPTDAVLAEFPFGEQECDLRYMYSSTFHWRRLLNGFSGGRPPHYPGLTADLSSALRDPIRAWRALERSPATHAVVHEGFWGIRRKGRRLTRWLIDNGGTVVARDGYDVLIALPRRGAALSSKNHRKTVPARRVWQNVNDESLARRSIAADVSSPGSAVW